jgi:hypothetical protein
MINHWTTKVPFRYKVFVPRTGYHILFRGILSRGYRGDRGTLAFGEIDLQVFSQKFLWLYVPEVIRSSRLGDGLPGLVDTSAP